ncbi:MAG: glycerol-3-phosphate 1-O-acyltransferase PlsY [bacterium]
MSVFIYIGVILLCYLVGSFPTAYLVVKKWAHKDVTQLGSGNIGTMNVHRATESKPLTLLVLVADMAKGAVAIVLARTLLSSWPAGPILTGAAAVLGHNYSAYMGLKGGRGLATAAGALIVYSPLLLLLWLGLWTVPYLLSKILVVGTLTATVLTPVAAYVLSFTETEITFTVVLSVIVLLRHTSKVRRLFEGTEPKKYWKIRDDGQKR